MIVVMSHVSDAYGRNKKLEEQTGVKAQKWANLFHRRQQPTGEMVEGLGKVKPEWAEWLLTGKIGVEQSIPEKALEYKVKKEIEEEAMDKVGEPMPGEARQDVTQIIELFRKMLLRELEAEGKLKDGYQSG